MKTLPLLACVLIFADGTSWAKDPVKADFVAHEWGTFTCVQASDGVQLEWNPLVAPELPKFVYDVRNSLKTGVRAKIPGYEVAGKTGTTSRQRMETPVIYFYSKEAQTVEVNVNFPAGKFTEWYPQLAKSKAMTTPETAAEVAAAFKARPGGWDGLIHWALDVLPGDGSAEAPKFPKDETGSHYYAARETEASALRVRAEDGNDQYEKFLFYRGVAQFEAPLQVSHWGDQAEQISLNNRGQQPVGPFFIFAVRGDRAALVEQARMPAGASEYKDFKFDQIARPAAEVRAELAGKLRASLASAGLYEKEAAAMVKTWEDSWLGEPGMRVLYLLPQKWTDEVLPLKISPAPREVKRVFVGRAEIITPAQEWALLKEVIHYAEGGTLERKAAVAAAANLGLGRFADAAMGHVASKGPGTTAFYQAITQLTRAIQPTPPKSPEGVTAAAQPVVTGPVAGLTR